MTFEEFILEEGFNPEYDEDKLHIHNMKAAWNAALEEAAKVAETGKADENSNSIAIMDGLTSKHIAKEIRSLKGD